MYGISTKFTKAKLGDLFHETVGTSVKSSAKPRVLVFNGLDKATHVYPCGTEREYDVVKWIVRSTGEEFTADADDRYGFYPRLDKKAVEKLEARRAQLAAELATYDYLLTGVAFCAELK